MKQTHAHFCDEVLLHEQPLERHVLAKKVKKKMPGIPSVPVASWKSASLLVTRLSTRSLPLPAPSQIMHLSEADGHVFDMLKGVLIGQLERVARGLKPSVARITDI